MKQELRIKNWMSVVLILGVFGAILILVMPGISKGQSSYSSTANAPFSENIGGGGTDKFSCDPITVATALLNKAKVEAAEAELLKKLLGIDDSQAQENLNNAEQALKEAQDIKKQNKSAPADTSDAQIACAQQMKNYADTKTKQKKAESKCFNGKASGPAYDAAEEEAIKGTDALKCDENEIAKYDCKIVATPNIESTSGDCRKASDTTRCTLSGFSCGVRCVKICTPTQKSVGSGGGKPTKAVYYGNKDVSFYVKRSVENACFVLSGVRVSVAKVPKNFSVSIDNGEIKICSSKLNIGEYLFTLGFDADTSAPQVSARVEANYSGMPIKGNIPIGPIFLSPLASGSAGIPRRVTVGGQLPTNPQPPSWYPPKGISGQMPNPDPSIFDNIRDTFTNFGRSLGF